MKRTLEGARSAGKSAGVLAANEELVERYAKLGFDFIAIASDFAFMLSAAQAALARMRKQTGVP